MPLRYDEINEVQEIAREIAKQEIAKAIKDLQKPPEKVETEPEEEAIVPAETEDVEKE